MDSKHRFLPHEASGDSLTPLFRVKSGVPDEVRTRTLMFQLQVESLVTLPICLLVHGRRIFSAEHSVLPAFKSVEVNRRLAAPQR